MLIAVVASAIGVAIDAGTGGGELTLVFSLAYAMGCLAAVLAVRQSGVFTAVIQPPLILFVAVPGAYFLMHSATIEGIKDVLINCGYPLIERFPLMFFTSATVLLIGLARWYFGASARGAVASPETREAQATPEVRKSRPGARLSARVAALFGVGAAAAVTAERPRRRKPDERRRAQPAERASRRPRPDKRAASRTRQSRAAETEIIEPVGDRPRKRRPRAADAPPPVEPRRRRAAAARDPRTGTPPGQRRNPYDRLDLERERAQRRERQDPPPRRGRYQGYDGYDGYEPMEPHGGNGNGTHHPVSRVRYRGANEADDRVEYRTRRHAPRDYDADRWEYDI